MLLLATSVIFAQGTIKGTVTDPDTGTPLPGANVMEMVRLQILMVCLP